jgi:hypothetical protein
VSNRACILPLALSFSLRFNVNVNVNVNVESRTSLTAISARTSLLIKDCSIDDIPDLQFARRVAI